MHPNFFVVGAHKAGTTSLHAYLDQHPDIYMSTEKEPRYYALAGLTLDFRGPNDPAAQCNYLTERQYLSLFNGVTQPVRGESSTLYLYCAHVPGRIKQDLGDVPIVIVLRDPVARAYSNYLHCTRDGQETLTFLDALAAEDQRVADGWGPLWHYRRKGLYYSQIRRYLETFESVWVGFYEDMAADRVGFVQDVYRFLDVDDAFVPETGLRYNRSGVPRIGWIHSHLRFSRSWKNALRPLLPKKAIKGLKRTSMRVQNWNLREMPRLPAEERSAAVELFRDDIRKVADLVNRDLSCWLST